MPPSKSARVRGTNALLGLIPGRVRDTIKMPGKSNKFDYSNRSNSGAKLGEIIAASLQRELEKAKKDADKAAAKARKQSSSSSVGGDGVAEQSSSTHTIDLKAPSKDLGDDGVGAMADGMEIVLRSGTAAASLALEDLNLAGNGLTMISLARLAPVIRLAKYDLKTVNLAGNKIEVVSDEQAQQWETFLLAFKNCMKLRRLDLSDNERLGSRALEIFARLHGSELQVTPNRPMGNASVLSLVSEDGEGEDDESEHVDSVAGGDDGEDADDSLDRMAHGGFLMRRCGLRSIPYITLHNVGLDDAGALWLSYVLEDHYYPSQLISELNATNAESIIKAYQQNTHSRGVDWNENKPLSKEGVQLLQKIETVREHRLHDDLAGNADLLDIDDEDGAENELPHAPRGSLDKLHARAKPGQRRASIRSIRTADGGEHETTELESARKKIMRHIIGHDGKASVELWRSSITVFWASRLVLYLAPAVRKHHTGEPLFATDIPAPPTVQPPSPINASTHDSGPGLRIDTEKAKETAQSPRASYASKLLAGTGAPGEPELAITEVTNSPTTPLRLQRPSHRKGAFSKGTDVEGVTTQLNALVVRDDSPLRFVKFQQRRIDAKAAEGKIFRDRRTPTHLPIDVAEYLVRFIVHARELEVCGGEQMRRAVERGQDKATLQAEREWLKKDGSAQVLMLLDSIKCLHYGQ